MKKVQQVYMEILALIIGVLKMLKDNDVKPKFESIN